MTTLLDSRPNAKAYTFSYRFQVGNPLRVTRTSELRIEREGVFEEVRLFLDAGNLVKGIEGAAEALDANVSFRSEDLYSGEVRAIPVVEWRSAAESSRARLAKAEPTELTVSIPAGTEIVVAGSLPIRFPHDTDIQVGASLGGNRMRGLRPVLLGGVPLLEVDAHGMASLRLQMSTTKTAILTLFGVVSPYRHRGEDALVHIMETIGNRVIGGTSIRARV